jgi:hypothetical protein
MLPTWNQNSYFCFRAGKFWSAAPNKGWRDPDSTMASVHLDCLDQSNNFSVVGAIVHPISLEESEQFLVGRHRGHNALSLGVIGAA